MEILRTEKLTKKFGGLTAVSGVDFRLDQNEIQSIIGPNGAGKSTLFRLINGEFKPTAGRIFFNGEDITALEQHVISRKGIATSYQITNIFPRLTAFENVRLAVQSRKTSYNMWSRAGDHLSINEETGEILRKIGLWGRKGELAANLSYGNQRHLEIGVALGTDPVLLLLDEPTSGLSPGETRETVSLIKEIARGLSVILVEHKMKVVMDLSDKITVLHEGEVIARGNPQEIRANETVRRVYLGGVKV
ncbi:MAG TPA: ABC transporter ATP-binding protein [Thermodesulfobacteriota bacterium]|nr:ABC transporter ATP-binding protein [Thermodesulfobacteriota bacterium]